MELHNQSIGAQAPNVTKCRFNESAAEAPVVMDGKLPGEIKPMSAYPDYCKKGFQCTKPWCSC